MTDQERAWTITRWRHAELPEPVRATMERAVRAEFDQFDIVRETAWSRPHWSWQIAGEEPAAFYHLVERAVRIDGAVFRVAGLNNLVTLPAFRGRGAASSLLRATQPQWFGVLGAQLGLLLCADALLSFYARLGWQQTGARVSFAQPDGPRIWAANCMLLDPSGRQGSWREIDLCGLPW